MAKFDENKVINVLHPEKAEVGKKYWFSDSLLTLKEKIENNQEFNIGILEKISLGFHSFITTSTSWEFIYPYEEQNQKMTNRQLAEWLAKGNGERKRKSYESIRQLHCYDIDEGNDFVDDILIRPWDSEEWIEPTVDIYERDCQHTDNIL